MAPALWRLSASEIKPLLDRGEVTVTRYVTSLLDRIRSRDDVTRAWVFLDHEQILKRAQELDALPVSARGPLHGIAVGIKDVILTKDMPTQYNSRLYASQEPIGLDASCVATLRAAGAVILGKTTTTEFAATREGDTFQNRTRNCHDAARTPGGSSSGSGCAVGDFHVPIALGTQTGGSTIRPGSFNGCYAFKPTWGLISREGLAQYSMTCDTLGLFSRSVPDLELLLDQAFDVHDDESLPNGEFQIKDARIGFCAGPVWPQAGPGTQKAWNSAQRILRDHGAIVEEVKLADDFDKVGEWHEAVLASEGQASFRGQYSQNKDLLASDLVAVVETRKDWLRRQIVDAYDGCAKLRPIWDSIARTYDAIITPSVLDEAPVGLDKTGSAVRKPPSSTRSLLWCRAYSTCASRFQPQFVADSPQAFCVMWSILHVPMLNVPGFAGQHGQPMGLSMVSARYHDRHLLYVARTLGRLFEEKGGWIRSNV